MTKTPGTSLREKLLKRNKIKQEHRSPHRDQMSFMNTACCSDHFHKANQNGAL